MVNSICSDIETCYYDSEFVKGFAADNLLSQNGILTTVINPVDTGNTMKILVLGKLNGDHYEDSEIQFSFTTSNPIPATGSMEVNFGNLIMPDYETIKMRCFDTTCDCPEDGSNAACEPNMVTCDEDETDPVY